MRNRYTFTQKIRLVIWLVRTKILWRQARLIRFPFDVRGIGFIDFGYNLTTGVGCRIEAFDFVFETNSSKHGISKYKIKFGKNVQINDYVHISAMNKVIIGDNVLMASHIYISDNSHGLYKGMADDTDPTLAPIKRPYYVSPVSIGDNTWIGEGVFIMPGVAIGRGCVIGAHSVVNKDIPDYSIAVGSPAKVVKQYNFEMKKWEKISI